MDKMIDARGLSCPTPVLMALNAVQAGSFPIEILVDGSTALENIQRLALKESCRVEIEEMRGEWKLTLFK